jgi:putative ABC transport system permease protein
MHDVNRLMRLGSLRRQFTMAIRSLSRDLKTGELTLIGIAVVIAVASMSAVDMFTDRIRQALVIQSSTLLAADLAVTSTNPIRDEHRVLARGLNLETVRLAAMRSVVGYGDTLQLVELKAAEAGYPLRGSLDIANEPFATPTQTDDVPAEGTVWVDTRLLQMLGARVGDRLEIGALNADIARVLVFEPDRAGELFSVAPRVLMNYADLGKTGLVLPGSRIRHTLLVAGERRAVEQFRGALSLETTERTVEPRSARPEIRVAVERAEQYLSLASLTAVLLAGIGIILASQRFAQRHLDMCAVLKALGATQGFISGVFVIEIALLGMAAVVAGLVLGFAVHGLLADALAGWTQGTLPPPSPRSAVRGAFVGLATLCGFSLPPLLSLRRVSPVRVLHRDRNLDSLGKGPLVVYAAATLVLIAPWRSGDWQVTSWALAGTAVCLLLLACAALIAVRLINRIRIRLGVAWRFGIANVARRASISVVQTAALGLGLMALLVLAIIRDDLVDQWQASLPPEAPNQFLINIQPQEVDDLKTFFRTQYDTSPEFYPMIRARLVAINGAAVDPDDYDDPRTRRLADREFNLSWAARLKSDNRIVAGQWWRDDEDIEQFSVEVEIAAALRIRLGDTLTYRIADRTLSARVTSLRHVNWDTMEANFFVVGPPDLLESYPATYITSFLLRTEDRQLLSRLVRSFPSVTVLDVAALMRHVRSIMDRVSSAVGFVFLFTLAAGVLVLVAAMHSTQEARIYDSAILKTLGASRQLVIRAISAEFLAIGLIAGTIAGIAALFSASLIAEHVLDLGYEVNPWVVPVGIGAGLLGVSAAGVLAIRSVLAHTVVQIMRRSP